MNKTLMRPKLLQKPTHFQSFKTKMMPFNSDLKTETEE